jgi:hypothetical protein
LAKVKLGAAGRSRGSSFSADALMTGAVKIRSFS